MNDLPIAMEGTISDYCDVIRTAGDRPISVDVLRFDTQEVLRGEINGDLPIEQVLSFAEEIDDDVDGRAAVLIGVQMGTEADFEALDTVIATFNLLG